MTDSQPVRRRTGSCPASLFCMAYVAGTTAGGGMLAVICHERKGDFLWQQ